MKLGKSIFKLSRSQWISVAVLASSLGLALAVTVPNSFTAGTPASATQVNDNFTALVTAVTTAETTLATKANSADVYTKTETDTALATKANIADVYTKTQIDASLANGMKAAANVASDGTVMPSWESFGTFTITKGAAGQYSINFPGLRPACAGKWPLLTLTPGFSLNGTVTIAGGVASCGTGDTNMSVTTRNSAFTAADGPFNFVAYSKPAGALPPFPAAARPAYTVCRVDSTGVETCE